MLEGAEDVKARTSGDLILGCFHALTWPQCEAFTVSARRHCPAASIVSVGVLRKDTAEHLLRHGVELYGHALPVHLAIVIGHIQNARYWLYADVLPRRRENRVFLADVRDVALQGNPFEHVPEDRILVPMEKRTFREDINERWLRAYLKAPLPENTRDLEVSCCGTVFGPMDLIRGYVDRIVASMMDRHELLPMIGLDQAIHNVMVHAPLAQDGFRRTVDEDGIIVTLSAWPWGVPYREVEDHVVLHQYERRPEIREEVYRQLGLNGDACRWSKGIEPMSEVYRR